jgi:3-hydroxyisobutyrate dehydrogenase
VLLGSNGILTALKPGTIIIDCSTALPSSTQKIAQQVAAAGGKFLDAPMTRTPKEAAQGRLNLLVGGDRDLFDMCLPVLSCFAENITHAGVVGDGHRMKLLHNYVSLGFIALLCEAAACANKAGIEPSVLVEVLSKGGGGSAALDRLSPFLLRGDHSALKFSMSNARKDLDYYCTMADQAQALHAISDSILYTYTLGTHAAGNDAGVLELAQILSQAAGKPN